MPVTSPVDAWDQDFRSLSPALRHHLHQTVLQHRCHLRALLLSTMQPFLYSLIPQQSLLLDFLLQKYFCDF
ncbi:hypothetical protein Plhal304r1_c002g0008251 [Plasmopara halstedii]